MADLSDQELFQLAADRELYDFAVTQGPRLPNELPQVGYTERVRDLFGQEAQQRMQEASNKLYEDAKKFHPDTVVVMRTDGGVTIKTPLPKFFNTITGEYEKQSYKDVYNLPAPKAVQEIRDARNDLLNEIGDQLGEVNLADRVRSKIREAVSKEGAESFLRTQYEEVYPTDDGFMVVDNGVAKIVDSDEKNWGDALDILPAAPSMAAGVAGGLIAGITSGGDPKKIAFGNAMGDMLGDVALQAVSYWGIPGKEDLSLEDRGWRLLKTFGFSLGTEGLMMLANKLRQLTQPSARLVTKITESTGAATPQAKLAAQEADDLADIGPMSFGQKVGTPEALSFEAATKAKSKGAFSDLELAQQSAVNQRAAKTLDALASGKRLPPEAAAHRMHSVYQRTVKREVDDLSKEAKKRFGKLRGYAGGKPAIPLDNTAKKFKELLNEKTVFDTADRARQRKALQKWYDEVVGKHGPEITTVEAMVNTLSDLTEASHGIQNLIKDMSKRKGKRIARELRAALLEDAKAVPGIADTRKWYAQQMSRIEKLDNNMFQRAISRGGKGTLDEAMADVLKESPRNIRKTILFLKQTDPQMAAKYRQTAAQMFMNKVTNEQGDITLGKLSKLWTHETLGPRFKATLTKEARADMGRLVTYVNRITKKAKPGLGAPNQPVKDFISGLLGTVSIIHGEKLATYGARAVNRLNNPKHMAKLMTDPEGIKALMGLTQYAGSKFTNKLNRRAVAATRAAQRLIRVSNRLAADEEDEEK